MNRHKRKKLAIMKRIHGDSEEVIVEGQEETLPVVSETELEVKKEELVTPEEPVIQAPTPKKKKVVKEEVKTE